MKFKGVVQDVLLESENTKWNKESGTILLEKKRKKTKNFMRWGCSVMYT